MLQAVVDHAGVNPGEVGDIVVGSVLAPGAQRANECRMASFFAGFPGRSCFYTPVRHMTSLLIVRV